MPDLLWLFTLPFLAALLIGIAPPFTTRALQRVATILSLFPLIFLVQGGKSWLSQSIDYVWFPYVNIHFHLAVDSLALLFLYLTTIIIPIAILAVRSRDLNKPKAFFSLIFILEALLIGFFTAQDLFFFTFFYEAMLIPAYLMINLWGGAKREVASLQFIIYMIGGSFLMIGGVLALYFTALTFNLHELSHAATAPWVAAVFFLAFAVKTPLFPFHAWLPSAYTQASTAGTILLSTLLSKAGIYGFIRIGLGVFPLFLKEWSPLLFALAVAGVFYGGLAAWAERDYKRLIAYSSFSHVNFILAGLFIWNETAHAGAILQSINHGITIAGLFLVAGWLEERLKSTSMLEASGLAAYMPRLCWLTLVFVLSSVALPGTNSFVGEIMIFFGLFLQSGWSVALLGLSIILSVIYMLRFMQKIYFEEKKPFESLWIDIRARELLIALPLVFLILWIGIYPKPLLEQVFK